MQKAYTVRGWHEQIAQLSRYTLIAFAFLCLLALFCYVWKLRTVNSFSSLQQKPTYFTKLCLRLTVCICSCDSCGWCLTTINPSIKRNNPYGTLARKFHLLETSKNHSFHALQKHQVTRYYEKYTQFHAVFESQHKFNCYRIVYTKFTYLRHNTA